MKVTLIFQCWWCRKVKSLSLLHHRIDTCEPSRPCCTSCYEDGKSVYRTVYENEEQERAEVAAAAAVRGSV